MATNPLPTKIGIILFPGFQLLDVAGPLDAFSILSLQSTLHLSILAATLDPVPTQTFAHEDKGSAFNPSLVPTHTFDNAPKDLEMILLPGGLGTHGANGAINIPPVVKYINTLDFSAKGDLKWFLTVCTGSEILARTGILDGRRATTNKRAFNEVKAKHPKVHWVPKARWVVDGNIWSGSGISAGMDLAFAWMAEVFGNELADLVADTSEYERNRNPENDRYAERWGTV